MGLKSEMPWWGGGNKPYMICDWQEGLKVMPNASVDCVVTSPPYWDLRDYGVEGQLGLEKDYKDYIERLCNGFDEVQRVLKEYGTCWVVLGDSFEKKSLCMIPPRFAIGMTKRGWVLRNVIVWAKDVCMPSSVDDRFTINFEYLFLFAKNRKYFFDQQFEAMASMSDLGEEQMLRNKRSVWNIQPDFIDFLVSRLGPGEFYKLLEEFQQGVKDQGAVWYINPKPYAEAHTAVFPTDLIEIPIKAGCPEEVCKKCGTPRHREYDVESVVIGDPDDNQQPEGRSHFRTGASFMSKRKFKGVSDCGCDAGWHRGIVLDPFLGSGTVIEVARKLNRNGIGFEINSEYEGMIKKRSMFHIPRLEQFNNTDGRDVTFDRFL